MGLHGSGRFPHGFNGGWRVAACMRFGILHYQSDGPDPNPVRAYRPFPGSRANRLPKS
jgi:hypothetical protein